MDINYLKKLVNDKRNVFSIILMALSSLLLCQCSLGNHHQRSDNSACTVDNCENEGDAPPGIGNQGSNCGQNNGENAPAGIKNDARDVGSTGLVKQRKGK